MATRYDIVDGPSEWNVILNLFNNTYVMPDHVRFNVPDLPVPSIGGGRLCVQITSASQCGNAGMAEWYFLGMTPQGWTPLFVKGKFSTQTRKGWVEEVSYEQFCLLTDLADDESIEKIAQKAWDADPKGNIVRMFKENGGEFHGFCDSLKHLLR